MVVSWADRRRTGILSPCADNTYAPFSITNVRISNSGLIRHRLVFHLSGLALSLIHLPYPPSLSLLQQCWEDWGDVFIKQMSKYWSSSVPIAPVNCKNSGTRTDRSYPGILCYIRPQKCVESALTFTILSKHRQRLQRHKSADLQEIYNAAK